MSTCTTSELHPKAITAKSINFGVINQACLEIFDLLMEELELDGEYQGREFVALNPRRDDTSLGSFKINSETGAWCDFADPDNAVGGDLISLVAYLKCSSQKNAALGLANYVTTLAAGSVQPQNPEAPASAAPFGREQGVSLIEGVDGAPELDCSAYVPHGQRLEDSYPYRDAQGRLAFTVLRIRKPDGSKTFLPISPEVNADGSMRWRRKMPNGLRPLFNLGKVLSAQQNALVFVVEGEKAAKALETMIPDAVVVTSAGGAVSPKHTDWSPLAGHSVVVWRDNDEAGVNYQNKVIEIIQQLEPAPSLQIVNLEALFRCICTMTGMTYEDQQADMAKWDAADVAQLALDREFIRTAISGALESAQLKDEEPESDFYPVATETGEEYLFSDTKGVHCWVKDKKGDDGRWAPVCSPLRVIGFGKDANDRAWSLLLEVKTPDGIWQQVPIEKRLLAEPRVVQAELLDRGLLIYKHSDFQNLLAGINPAARFRLTDHVGWNDGAYLLQPGQIFGSTETPLLLKAEATARHNYTESGNLSDWHDQIGQYCVGNSRLTLGVCVALAGPLLHLLGQENGGVHLVGPSSIGKTTVLRVGASVWGMPSSIIKTWRATSNGLESVAESLNDNVLFIDEMNQATPAEAGSTVYMLGNGTGKTRSTTRGTLGRVKSWRLVYVSTGEIPLAEHLNSAGQQVRAGMEVRLLNIPANAGQERGIFEELHQFSSGAELSMHLNAASNEANGTLGTAWLHYLVENAPNSDFIATAKRRMEEIALSLCSAGNEGQVHRAAQRLALFALAGELAAASGLTGWESGWACQAAKICFDAWLAERGGESSGEDLQAFRQVQRYLERYGQVRFQRIGVWLGDDTIEERQTVVDRAGYVRRTDSENFQFEIFPGVFEEQICAGINCKVALAALDRRGYILKQGSSSGYKSSVRIPGLAGIQRLYRISGNIIAADPTVESSENCGS